MRSDRKKSKMPLHFKGIAHPPPPRNGKRSNPADMSVGDIATTNLGLGAGTQLLYEHDHSSNVGHVTSSWEGPRGEFRVSGVVTDPQTERDVRSGKTRGLSLGTSVITGESGQRIHAQTDELSLCAQPKRGGCYVNEIEGKTVHRVANFSKPQGVPLST